MAAPRRSAGHPGSGRDHRAAASGQVPAYRRRRSSRRPVDHQRFRHVSATLPNRPALIDELGTLTYRELDQRSDALAAALQGLPTGTPEVVAIMCRNHRGFVEALIAANRIGADVLLLNTSFAGPALADVVDREGVDAIIYDEEFTDSVDRALADKPDSTRIVAWTDHPTVMTPPSRS